MMLKGKTVCVSLIVFGALLAGMPKARAQSQQQESVAEAARRAREQKKEAAKPATVITNDTLEPAKDTAATPASPAAEATGAAPSANLAVTAAGADPQIAGSAGNSAVNETSKDADGAQAELKALKQEIAEKQLDVDLAQRELALANDDFYSRPDFSHDDTGKAKLDAMQSDLAQKQDELAQLKARLPAGASAKEEKPAGAEAQPQPASETQPQAEQPNPPQQP